MMRVLKDPLTGEMTLEGGALVLADQVIKIYFYFSAHDWPSTKACAKKMDSV